MCRLPLCLIWKTGLLPDIQLGDDVAISVQFYLLKIVQEPSTLTYQFKKTQLCVVIFLIHFKMFGQVIDSVGKKSNL